MDMDTASVAELQALVKQQNDKVEFLSKSLADEEAILENDAMNGNILECELLRQEEQKKEELRRTLAEGCKELTAVSKKLDQIRKKKRKQIENNEKITEQLHEVCK